MTHGDAKTGVLLLNMGGPETLAEVRPFLFRLFRDPDILPLPRWLRWLSWPLALLISTLRAPKSRAAYAAIGGGSPQRRTNQALADKLAAHLDLPVAVAMRYWRPTTDQALDTLQGAGVSRIVVLPMYPHYSTTTTMSGYRALHRALSRRDWRPALAPILDYHLEPGYLNCVRRRLAAALTTLPGVGPATVLFSAHAIPADRVADLGDPYPGQIEAMVAALAAELPAETETALAYQSKVGPVSWLGPATPEVVRDLAAAGTRRLLFVPVSFVSEHIETLEEIDLRYVELARASGIEAVGRVPTVGADDDFVAVLADLVGRAGDRAGASCRRGAGPRCICLS